jgi:hypothetical protein
MGIWSSGLHHEEIMISFSRDNNIKIFRGKGGYVIFLKKFLLPNFKEFEEKLLTSYLKK